MNRRTFFISAVLLALIALLTHAVATDFLADAIHLKAALLEQAQKQQIAYKTSLEARSSSRNYRILRTVGFVLTGLSLLCTVTALVRREPGLYLILILLLFFDILTPMVL